MIIMIVVIVVRVNYVKIQYNNSLLVSIVKTRLNVKIITYQENDNHPILNSFWYLCESHH